MAPTSPRGARIRQCRCGKRREGGGTYNLHPAKGIRVMRMVSRRCRWSLSLPLVFTLLCMCSPVRVHADGGAPNLAYVSGTPSGVSVIDVLQGKITKILSVAGDPHTILLSLDGRFLYVTQPGLGQVSAILAETGRLFVQLASLEHLHSWHLTSTAISCMQQAVEPPASRL
jgi:hypothetical protein